MDYKLQLSDIVKSIKYGENPKVYLYPYIPDKVKVKVAQHYDAKINPENIVAVIDTTLIRNLKTGTVFTVSGVYDRASLEKPFYFNYKDVKQLYLRPDEKGRTEYPYGTLEITLDDDRKYSTTNYAEPFADVIRKIIFGTSGWEAEITNAASGVVYKAKITMNDQKKCHAIIHSAAAAAGGVGTGLAQLPLADAAVITPIQVAMISSIGAVFGIRATEGVAKAIIGSMSAAAVGRGVSQLLLGWIPVIGNAINTATAAGITEAIGWVAVKHFFEAKNSDIAKYRIEGMAAGYEAASDEYERKLRSQAEMFLKVKEVAADQKTKYQALLEEYEGYIEKLEKTINVIIGAEHLTPDPESINNLNTMKEQYNELMKIQHEF